MRAAAATAKFLYHGESRVNPQRGVKAYSDLEVVQELRAMSTAAKRQGKVAPRVAGGGRGWGGVVGPYWWGGSQVLSGGRNVCF